MIIHEATRHLPFRSGVYQIRNIATGQSYIGSSQNVRNRCNQHRCTLGQNTHKNPRLQEAWNTFGAEGFEFRLLEECAVDVLIERENHWIRVSRTQGGGRGYNLFEAEATGRGYKQTPEHIQKRFADSTNRACPDTTKKAVAAANKTRVWTEAQREAARIRLAKGKAAIPKDEFSRRCSESMKGRVMSEEQKQLLSRLKTGKPRGSRRVVNDSPLPPVGEDV